MSTSHKGSNGPTALDVLEQKDLSLLESCDHLMAYEPQSHPRLAKTIADCEREKLARQFANDFATREAALVDVVRGLGSVDELRNTVRIMESDVDLRRQLFGRTLRRGRHFEPFEALVGHMRTQICWETGEAIPNIRKQIEESTRSPKFRPASYVRNHAPLRLDPKGPRWFESAPLVSRVLTIFDRATLKRKSGIFS